MSRVGTLFRLQALDLELEAGRTRLAEIEQHLASTHFCWIGGYDEDSPFYYRIQSPVLIIEFDHHAGVFLANPEARNFHIHSLVRTPTANDYGMALIRQHCECHQRAMLLANEPRNRS